MENTAKPEILSKQNFASKYHDLIINKEVSLTRQRAIDCAHYGASCYAPYTIEIVIDHMYADYLKLVDVTKKEQEQLNHYDLREMAHYYGSWSELRKVIDQLEQNDAEAAYDRAYSNQ